MIAIKRIGYALALCCSVIILASCGTNDENASNEMQDEAGTNLREEPGARGTDQNTPGRQAGEGQLGNDDVDAGMTGSRIGGEEMTPSQSVVENISANNNLTVLMGALRQAELIEALNGTGPYTVFAPTNEAFEALPEGTLDNLMQTENRKRLVELLNNHVVAGKLTAANLTDGATLKTASGKQLNVTKRGNDVMVNGAKVLQADIESKNGVIHIVEKVMVGEG
ncbi:fasciclin domain-containing protein [Pontibacter litorisediminis]|uniref:fasciclin domain-containing protein n=1 Tax=Pontibacter litorisediminis TaxID=1846260 RepID=UPI0023EC4E95|nr:fasciclin domain-containing protein [Pontibacter litorisediminis]